MFSVIIPTLWKSKKTIDLLKSFVENKKISEIILIDNNPKESQLKNIENKKIKVYPFDENIYVNPSWNFGISKTKEENIIICNDDLDFDTNSLNNFIIEEDTIIGVDQSCYSLEKSENIRLESCEQISFGFGCLLLLKKKYYKIIPEIFKIYYGDNFLFESFKYRKKIFGLKIDTLMSESCRIDCFAKKIQEDIANNMQKHYRTFIDKLN